MFFRYCWYRILSKGVLFMKHTIDDLIKFAEKNGYPKNRIDELRQVTPHTLGAAQILNASVSIVEKIDALSGD